MNPRPEASSSTENSFTIPTAWDGLPTGVHEYPGWLTEAKTLFDKDFVAYLNEEHRQSPLWSAIRHAVIPGRRIRPALYYAFWKTKAGHFPNEEERVPAIAIELFHAASIVLDDIADGEAWRRDKRPVYRQFDLNTAILVSHYLVAAAYSHIAHHPKSAALHSVASACYMQAVQGQAHDLGLDASSPLVSQHEDAIKKTSAFFRFVGESLDLLLPQLDGNGAPHKDFFELLGEAFQVGNDVVDLLFFEQNGRHNEKEKYALRPSRLVRGLIEANVIDADELYTLLPFARHIEIAREARNHMHKFPIIRDVFRPTLNELEYLTLDDARLVLVTDFIRQTTEPTFWLHFHG